MSYTINYDGDDIELDDDITVDDLDNHPAPENALDAATLEAIEDDEAQLGE